MTLKHSDKIFVAGHRGLVGSAIVEILEKRGYKNIVTRTRDELNLLDTAAVDQFYSAEKPDFVFVAAAKVGGILANNTYRADFIWENLQIQNNLIWGAHKANVRQLVFLGSSCIYPKEAPQPMPETCLLTGPLEYTNRPYALAKIAGLELVNSLRLQYGRDYFSVMPTNLYGPRDNFHPENSHVLPALIRKFVEAVDTGEKEVVIWGSGEPRREFMYSLDCADAIVLLAECLSQKQWEHLPQAKVGCFHVNVGTGEEISIRELAITIATQVRYSGAIRMDDSKPDGPYRKLLEISQLRKFSTSERRPIATGICETIQWYLENLRISDKIKNFSVLNNDSLIEKSKK